MSDTLEERKSRVANIMGPDGIHVTLDFNAEAKTIRATAQVANYPWCVSMQKMPTRAVYSRSEFPVEITALIRLAVTEAVANMYNSDMYWWWELAGGKPEA